MSSMTIGEALIARREKLGLDKGRAADLIGIPWQVLVGPKGLAEGKLEIKRRSDGSRENLSPADVVARLTS